MLCEYKKIDDTILRETPNLPSLIFSLLPRYLDMIIRELDKAENQNRLQMKEKERHHQEENLLSKQTEEVRNTKF